MKRPNIITLVEILAQIYKTKKPSYIWRDHTPSNYNTTINSITQTPEHTVIYLSNNIKLKLDSSSYLFYDKITNTKLIHSVQGVTDYEKDSEFEMTYFIICHTVFRSLLNYIRVYLIENPTSILNINNKLYELTGLEMVGFKMVENDLYLFTGKHTSVVKVNPTVYINEKMTIGDIFDIKALLFAFEDSKMKVLEVFLRLINFTELPNTLTETINKMFELFNYNGAEMIIDNKMMALYPDREYHYSKEQMTFTIYVDESKSVFIYNSINSSWHSHTSNNGKVQILHDTVIANISQEEINKLIENLNSVYINTAYVLIENRNDSIRQLQKLIKQD